MRLGGAVTDGLGAARLSGDGGAGSAAAGAGADVGADANAGHDAIDALVRAYADVLLPFERCVVNTRRKCVGMRRKYFVQPALALSLSVHFPVLAGGPTGDVPGNASDWVLAHFPSAHFQRCGVPTQRVSQALLRNSSVPELSCHAGSVRAAASAALRSALSPPATAAALASDA